MGPSVQTASIIFCILDLSIITTRNSSCWKVMFSQVSVYPQGGGYPRSNVRRVTPPRPDVSTRGPTLPDMEPGIPIPSPLDMGPGIPYPFQYWHLVVATARRMVAKWVVHILLECFLVNECRCYFVSWISMYTHGDEVVVWYDIFYIIFSIVHTNDILE